MAFSLWCCSVPMIWNFNDTHSTNGERRFYTYSVCGEAALCQLVLLDPSAWRLAPAVIVEQGRVAIGDGVAECLGSSMSVVLIGERPGLSSPDSLGIYLTWNPRPGRTNANRNCISNIRAEGLSYAAAAHGLVFLMRESRHKRLSGVDLKGEANCCQQLE